MNFYIGDTHFGHKNCIKHDNRPFYFIEDHDRVLMDLWNDRVSSTDDVIIVGDFTYKAKEHFSYYASKLNGRKILVVGNHDKHIVRDPAFESHFSEKYDMLEVVDGQHKIFICHCPMAEWPGTYHGVKHFYAHVHGNPNPAHEFMKTQPGAYNVGAMHQKWRPWTAEEVIAKRMSF